jgi:TonB family protein
MRTQILAVGALMLFGLFLPKAVGRDLAIVDEKSYPVYEFITEVKPTSMVNPVYPSAAKEEKRGGRISVGTLVDEKGKVQTTFIHKSDAAADLEDAARAAVAKWRFPKQKDGGQSIKYVVFVPIIMTPQ